jgi:hypothetical protein
MMAGKPKKVASAAPIDMQTAIEQSKVRLPPDDAILSFLSIVQLATLWREQHGPDAQAARTAFEWTAGAAGDLCFSLVTDDKLASKLRDHFSELSGILHDLDDGIISPVIEPPKLGHRAPDSEQIWSWRGAVVEAMDLLKAARGTYKLAARALDGSKYPHLHLLCSKGTPHDKGGIRDKQVSGPNLYSSITSWRAALAKLRGKEKDDPRKRQARTRGKAKEKYELTLDCAPVFAFMARKTETLLNGNYSSEQLEAQAHFWLTDIDNRLSRHIFPAR